jgi:hypothetical protein
VKGNARCVAEGVAEVLEKTQHRVTHP